MVLTKRTSRFISQGLAIVFVCIWFTARSAERQILHNHLPQAVIKQSSTSRLTATNHLKLAIALPLRNQAGLTNLLEQIYDPASPSFHHYLTPEQFTERFGPTREDYQAVIDFAKSHGLTVAGAHANRAVLDVTGPVANIEKAFHVHLHKHQHPSEARTFYAPDVEPSFDMTIPILEVKGLDDYDLPRPMYHRRTNSISAKAAKAEPAVGSGPGGTFMGNDFRSAYLPGVTLTGAGQKVGLFELDGYYTNDPAQYANLSGLTNSFAITNVYVDGFDGTPSIHNVEVALDIEMVMAMAPGAQVVVYQGPISTPTVVIDVLNRMASDNLAKQLSASWTYPTGPAMVQVYQQMAAQGQSFFNCSGDHGAYSGQVTTPCDNPYITIVGGTTLTTVNGSWAGETAWNWASIGHGPYATGGGISTSWAIPSWQQGISMTSNHGSATQRNLPDVSMVGDYVSIVADNGQQEVVGGTSVATPLWAAFTALVNQKAAAQSRPPVGFINPVIYGIGKSANYNTRFHDIISGNNTNSSSPNNFPSVSGYDLCTGWGSPQTNLIDAMLNYQSPTSNGWTLTSLPSYSRFGVACSADGSLMLTAGGTGYINISYNFGTTWGAFGIPGLDDIYAASADGTKLVMGQFNGSIHVSTNSGFTWTPATAPDGYSYRWLSSSYDGNKIVAGALFEGVMEVSTNAGASWKEISVPGGPNFTPVAWSGDGNVLVSACGKNVYVSTNSGVSSNMTTISGVTFAGLAASADGSKLIAVGKSSIYISTNLGINWTSANAPTQVWRSVCCSADGTRIAAAVNGGLIYFSNDGGRTWSDSGAPSSGWYSIACSADGSRLIASSIYDSGSIPVYTGFFPLSPTILSQPTNQTVQCGQDATFRVKASGTTPVSYQWYFGATPLADGDGITGSSTTNLTLKTVSLSQSGNYSVIVGNPYGSTNSFSTTLTVLMTNRPVLNLFSVQADGTVSGAINGFAGLTYIEASTNLVNWTVVTNLVLTNSSTRFTILPSTPFTQQFYRARVQ